MKDLGKTAYGKSIKILKIPSPKADNSNHDSLPVSEGEVDENKSVNSNESQEDVCHNVGDNGEVAVYRAPRLTPQPVSSYSTEILLSLELGCIVRCLMIKSAGLLSKVPVL